MSDRPSVERMISRGWVGRWRLPGKEADMVLDIAEDLTPFVRGMRICGECFELYEFRLQGAVSRQRCICPDRPPAGSTWPGHDFNEHLHLCECCSMVPLLSGSKWSVWLCKECLPSVNALNRAAGRCLIPIGRHSLMNGVGVEGRRLAEETPAELDASVEEFRGKLMGLFDAMEHLHEGARRRRAELASALGLAPGDDIPLDVWLESLCEAAAGEDASCSAEASFTALVQWFSGELPG